MVAASHPEERHQLVSNIAASSRGPFVFQIKRRVDPQTAKGLRPARLWRAHDYCPLQEREDRQGHLIHAGDLGRLLSGHFREQLILTNAGDGETAELARNTHLLIKLPPDILPGHPGSLALRREPQAGQKLCRELTDIKMGRQTRIRHELLSIWQVKAAPVSSGHVVPRQMQSNEAII